MPRGYWRASIKGLANILLVAWAFFTALRNCIIPSPSQAPKWRRHGARGGRLSKRRGIELTALGY